MWQWKKIYKQHDLSPDRLIKGDLNNDLQLMNDAIGVGVFLGTLIAIYMAVHSPLLQAFDKFLSFLWVNV